MDTGLGIDGRTDGQRTRDKRWDRWIKKIGMERETDGHRTRDGR